MPPPPARRAAVSFDIRRRACLSSLLMGRRRAVRIIFLMMALAFAAPAAAPRGPNPVQAKRGMVVSSERRATEVGLSVLKSGGNAVDAAVAGLRPGSCPARRQEYPGRIPRPPHQDVGDDLRLPRPARRTAAMFLTKRRGRDNANHRASCRRRPQFVMGLELATGNTAAALADSQPAVRLTGQASPWATLLNESRDDLGNFCVPVLGGHS
jgi:hypothetical protein